MFNFLKKSSFSSYHFLINTKNNKTPVYLKNDKKFNKRPVKSVLHLQVNPFANIDLLTSLVCRNFTLNPLPFFLLSDHGNCAISLINNIKKVNPQQNIVYDTVVLDNPELISVHKTIKHLKEILPTDAKINMGLDMKDIIGNSYTNNSFCAGILTKQFYKDDEEKIAKSKKNFFDYLEMISEIEIKNNKPFIFVIAYSSDHFNKKETKFIHDTLAIIKSKNCIIFNFLSDYGYMKDNNFPSLGKKGLYNEYWLNTSGFSSEIFFDIYSIYKTSFFNYLPSALKTHFKKNSDFLKHALVYKEMGTGQSCFIFKANKTWEFASNIV